MVGSSADLTPPTVPDDAIATTTVEVDPNDLPADVDPDDVETRQERIDVGMSSEGYRTERVHVVEQPNLAETLTQTKLTYGRTILERIRDGDWQGTLLAIDGLLGCRRAGGT